MWGYVIQKHKPIVHCLIGYLSKSPIFFFLAKSYLTSILLFSKCVEIKVTLDTKTIHGQVFFLSGTTAPHKMTLRPRETTPDNGLCSGWVTRIDIFLEWASFAHQLEFT